MAGPTRVALALGSGGARGYAHIGVIEALEERGLEIAGVAGSSMGALVGGLYAAGRLDDYTRWATSLTQLDVLRLLDVSLSAPGAIHAEKILDKVREILGDTPHRGAADPVHGRRDGPGRRTIRLVPARPRRRGDPRVHRDSRRDHPVRAQRAGARGRRDPRSAAARPDPRRGCRRHHRCQSRGRGTRRRRRRPGPRECGAATGRRVDRPIPPQRRATARAGRRPLDGGSFRRWAGGRAATPRRTWHPRTPRSSTIRSRSRS